MADASRDFLRHTLATLAYRAAKVLRTAPAEIATVNVPEGSRSPVAILAHIADLMEWALWLSGGGPKARNSPGETWEVERERFLTAIARFDEHLASAETLDAPPERLFQGPIADALTHVGQLALLCRAAGMPVRGENYFKADIQRGQVGLNQPPPVREF